MSDLVCAMRVFSEFIKRLPVINRVRSAGKFYICHGAHPNDKAYTENLIDFFQEEGINVETIALSPGGSSSELLHCLNDTTIGVLGLNSQLDHTWIGAENFLDLALRANVPVIHWVLDHPSSRWPEFTKATTANSRFLFLSPFSESYFQRYGLPGSVTGSTSGNTGVSRHSRAWHLGQRDFKARPYNCIVPMNLRRIGGTLEDALARRDGLEPKLGNAVQHAIELAYFDLDHPIETHLAGTLAAASMTITNDRFNFCLQIVEEAVQIKRRQWIFSVARDYPVLIQSDETARPFAGDSRAEFEAGVDMRTTLSRMKLARAVLNASHVNDELHTRTINGLNAGCASIIEDNVIHRRLFKDRENALLFRYDDDSLRRCLDIVCTDLSRTYCIASGPTRCATVSRSASVDSIQS